MTERNIDFELIMALAEESLPPDEAAAAEAALDSAAREELAAQRLALAALADIGPAAMSTDERSDLRARLRAELRMPQETDAVIAPAAPRTPWYVRALPALGAAAALVFVVGIGVTQLGGNDQDSTAERAVDLESTPADELLQGEQDSSLAGSTDGAQTFATTTAAATAATEAAPPTEATADVGVEESFARMMTPDDLGSVTLDDVPALASKIDRAAEDLFQFFPLSPSELPAAAIQPGLICWEEVLPDLDDDAEVDYMGVALVDGIESEVYRRVDAAGLLTIIILATPDCAVTEVLEP